MRYLKIIFSFFVFSALYKLITAAISGTLSDDDLEKMSNGVVEVDIGGAGSAWAAIESWALTVEPTRGTVPVTSEMTLDAEQHVGVGNQEISRVRVSYMATKGSTDPLENLYALVGSSSPEVDVRWSNSGAANESRFYTENGVIVDHSPPGQDANNSENKKVIFEIACTDITRETIST